MAPAGHHRRFDCRGRRDSEGDGLRHHRGIAGAGRALHGVPADADLCGAGHFAAAQRQYHHHHSHPRRSGDRRGGAGGERRIAAGRFGDADPAGRRHAPGGRGTAPGFRRQLHLRTGADWIQGGHRAGHRVRSGPEAAGHSFPQGSVLPQSPGYRQRDPGLFVGHGGGWRRDGGHAGSDRAPAAAGAGAADRGGQPGSPG